MSIQHFNISNFLFKFLPKSISVEFHQKMHRQVQKIKIERANVLNTKGIKVQSFSGTERCRYVSTLNERNKENNV